ncbi:MAG TPA: SDR family oxidoreductase [Acidimicrobiia bacterium]|nr:SDR family oxidoreductase [Acidimicrobiia bacterium]
MQRLVVWPSRLPAPLEEAVAALESRSERLTRPASPDEVLAQVDSGAAVVIFPDAAVAVGAASHDDVMRLISDLGAIADVSIVAVVSDAYLGIDVADIATPATAAAVISAMRSIAVRRGSTTRANAVCVPAGMVSDSGSQRGAMSRAVEPQHVASTVAFLTDPANSYISGQVLFVDGGRHLFSSMTA